MPDQNITDLLLQSYNQDDVDARFANEVDDLRVKMDAIGMHLSDDVLVAMVAERWIKLANDWLERKLNDE